MDYRDFSPSATLKPLVKCFWTLDAEPSERPVRQTIVPDGCPELIFHYGELYRQYFNDQDSIVQPRCFVMGQLTRPLEIEPLGQTGIFAVRFWPDGLSHFVSIDPANLADRAVPLGEVWGTAGTELEADVLAASTTAHRIERIEQFLVGMLTDPSIADQVLSNAVASLYQTAGHCAIAKIAESLDISAKHLERKFKSKVGLSPKQLARLIRLQATLRQLAKHPDQTMTSIAMHGQYCDQSHFIKDFREFTGLTPKQFFGAHLQLSQLFQDDGEI